MTGHRDSLGDRQGGRGVDADNGFEMLEIVGQCDQLGGSVFDLGVQFPLFGQQALVFGLNRQISLFRFCQSAVQQIDLAGQGMDDQQTAEEQQQRHRSAGQSQPPHQLGQCVVTRPPAVADRDLVVVAHETTLFL